MNEPTRWYFKRLLAWQARWAQDAAWMGRRAIETMTPRFDAWDAQQSAGRAGRHALDAMAVNAAINEVAALTAQLAEAQETIEGLGGVGALESLRLALSAQAEATALRAQLAEAQRERDENEGAFKVWRRRAEQAQAEVTALREALAKAEAERDEARAKHAELIYQVGSKYPGESRHDTAKRYIAEHENCGRGGPAMSSGGQPPTGGQTT